ncbi:MAG: hypothetical protein LIO65_04005 [Odoribacter sp.]|nr:hypothetical protein [Odoribacter sp.]
MTQFSKTEKTIKKLFTEANEFEYGGVKYTVLQCGKPAPSQGECKTDVYVLTKDENSNIKEFKISVKQNNADFLENKIKLERAIEILGKDAQSIIEKSISRIKKSFEDDYLVYFKSHKKTEAYCIKMGWKFEFINKSGGEKCGIIELTDQQKIDIYAGITLSLEKKNCMINGEIIKNCGIANYIINVDVPNQTLDYYLKKMLPIEDFAKQQNIYLLVKL